MTTLSATGRLPAGHPIHTLTEKQLQGTITDMATLLGWRWFHVHDSRRSPAGFPDLVLVHPGQGRTLWRELKTAKGRVSPDQKVWLADLVAAGEDADVWRPADLASGRVLAELRGQG
ncbi:VRR-NUC domain-containing protein [Citricoccus sp. K5]|uniref:VRR-NUC domain-containing protein n=1 Tax=Citricoccus sp. K5 TaxID=2653135 RepID=UPI0012EFCDA6|nr:VRR-NUC domain-containing protein [Citricoccus sp. K5]VXA93085.1 VRR-NUC domain-containing protein [Citricoccus sp. K5]VXA95638.1 VRR-NUC domain-containing protein [Citricoccus sp. K5]